MPRVSSGVKLSIGAVILLGFGAVLMSIGVLIVALVALQRGVTRDALVEVAHPGSATRSRRNV